MNTLREGQLRRKISEVWWISPRSGPIDAPYAWPSAPRFRLRADDLETEVKRFHRRLHHPSNPSPPIRSLQKGSTKARCGLLRRLIRTRSSSIGMFQQSRKSDLHAGRDSARWYQSFPAAWWCFKRRPAPSAKSGMAPGGGIWRSTDMPSIASIWTRRRLLQSRQQPAQLYPPRRIPCNGIHSDS